MKTILAIGAALGLSVSVASACEFHNTTASAAPDSMVVASISGDSASSAADKSAPSEKASVKASSSSTKGDKSE